MGWAVNALLMIVFLFCGHSNLEGGCAAGCGGAADPHIYTFDRQKGFQNDIIDKTPIMMFLHEMVLRYPGYNFCGINYAQSSMKISELKPGNNHYDKMMADLIALRGKATIGGLICNFGIIEGRDSEDGQWIGQDHLHLLYEVRRAAGCSKIPLIVYRYEKNYLGNDEFKKYERFNRTVMSQLDSLSSDPLIIGAPVYPVPKPYMCENHHDNCDGNRIRAEDAATLYQLHNLDYWKEGSK